MENADLVAIVKALAKAVLSDRAEIHALGVALASRGIVPIVERASALADMQPLTDLLDQGNLDDFLLAFERRFPNA